MSKSILLLEGGAYRGIYTAGVLDAFLKNDISFDAVVGISAGAMTGWNFISRQIYRTKNIIYTFGNDSRYFGFRAFLSCGGFTGFKFIFDTVNKKYFPFDYNTAANNPSVFAVGATSLSTSEITYFEFSNFKNVKDFEKCIIASSSMPLISRSVKIDNVKYLDGGVFEHLPLNYLYNHPQYDKAVAVLTRPLTARKYPINNKLKKAYNLFYGKYPKFLEKLINEDRIFNAQREEINDLYKLGNLMIFAPDETFKVNRIEKDFSVLSNGYELGFSNGMEKINDLKQYLNC